MKFFNTLTIARKLPLSLFLSGVVVSLGVGFASYQISASALDASTRQNLSAVARERSHQLNGFVAATARDVMSTAKQSSTIMAARDFRRRLAADEKRSDGEAEGLLRHQQP